MYEWAKDYPEVLKICRLFDLIEFNNPVNYNYTSLPCLLQEGPQCGIVALAMCLPNASKEIVGEVLAYAKLKGFTNNGEIFSAQNLLEIAQFFLKDKDVSLHKNLLAQDQVKKHLLKGDLMLVPYDTDKNFQPCLRNGHKAHWATISGAIETDTDFYIIARHGKARNIAFWSLKELADSNRQLNEFSPERQYSNLTYKLPNGGINGPRGISSFSILISQKM